MYTHFSTLVHSQMGRFSFLYWQSTMQCPICLSEPVKKLQRHYGGNYSCFNCKLFFRRFVKWSCHLQKNLNPCLQALKSGLSCNLRGVITCKKCRYLACLLNGMQPDLVFAADTNPYELEIHDLLDMNQPNVQVYLNDIDEMERFFDVVAQSFFE